MKLYRLVPVLATLLLMACVYDAPLVATAELPIDPAVLGIWQALPTDADDAGPGERLVVTQASPKEYAIVHIDGESAIYFRGWLAEVEGIRFVQLQITGDEHGPAGAAETDRFAVVRFQLQGGELVMTALNTRYVDANLPTTEALQQAFAKNRDHPDLFAEPGRYRRL
jgi:hypothetical protein